MVSGKQMAYLTKAAPERFLKDLFISAFADFAQKTMKTQKKQQNACYNSFEKK